MIVPPGSTIGIVGGGQLGRMLAMAAARLGYRCHVFAPDHAPPAAEVAARFTRGDYRDEVALALFGEQVDIATYEFENIAAGPLAALAGKVPLYPPRAALEISQDRLQEKEFVVGLGGRTAPFLPADDPQSLEAAVNKLGCPAILKSRRFGYDGKGQARINMPREADEAWASVGGVPSIVEAVIDFQAEFSILLCRSVTGAMVAWDIPENVHGDGILRKSVVPGGTQTARQGAAALQLARAIAQKLDYVGVLTLEFFATPDGPVFNEMAPRVHNSGHWTLEGAITSQFENHIRALCGLPLGATGLTAARVAMDNLIGDEADHWREILSDPAAHLHLYGKHGARPGRKMGHVTRLFDV